MAGEHVTRTYAIFWLLNLLLVTCVPFSTMLVGRYADVPLAIWIYVGNLGLNGVTALAMVTSMREAHQASAERRGGVTVSDNLLRGCRHHCRLRAATGALGFDAQRPADPRFPEKPAPRLVKQARDALFFGRTRDRLADERPDR
jgi:hypothetical protein